MKKGTILVALSYLILFSFSLNAQEKLPDHSISLTGGVNLNGGYEYALCTENYFGSNHSASLYGMVNYHYAFENWQGQSVHCKKALAEIGGKKYFAAVKNRFYPFLGLGITAGIQNIEQRTFNNSHTDVVNEDTDPFIFGFVGNVGLEYMFTRNIAVEVLGRVKYDLDSFFFIIGGGVKFSF